MEQNTIQTYKKSDYLSATEIAKKYNLDLQNTYNLMLSLFKNRTKFTYISNNTRVSNIMVLKFSHTSSSGKHPLKLHPLAEQLFLEKYNKRYDTAEQLNAGTQILNAGIKMAEIKTVATNAADTNTKGK